MISATVTLAACSPVHFVSVEARPSDLIIFAVVAPSAEVRSVSLARADETWEADSEDGASVVSFVLEPTRFLGVDGRSLLEGEAVGFSVRRAQDSPASGSCGRCPTMDAGPPLVMIPGASCAIPPFAAGQAHASSDFMPDVDAIRARLALDLSGPCACESPVLPSPTRPGLDVIALDGPAWPVEAFAETASGAFGMFSERGIVRVSREGVSRERMPPFVGPILSAAGAADGGFVVAQYDVAARAPRTYVLDAELESWRELAGTGPDTDKILFDPRSGDYYLTTLRRERSTLFGCAIEESAWSCGPIEPGGEDPFPIGELAVSQWGERLAATSGERLLFLSGSPSPPPVRWVTLASGPGWSAGEFETSGSRGKFTIQSFSSQHGKAVPFGRDGVAVCGSVPAARAVIHAARLPSEPGPLELRPVATFEGVCAGMAPIPGGDEFWFQPTLDQVARCDFDGCGQLRPLSTELGLEGAWSSLRPSGFGTVHGESVRELVVLGPPATRRFGAPAREEVVAILPLGGELAVVRRDGSVSAIRDDVEQLGFVALPQGLTAAATDAARGGLAAVGFGPGPFMVRASWPDVVPETQALPARLGVPVGFGEVGPDRFLLLTQGGQLWVLVGGETREVEVSWDDPSTEAREILEESCTESDLFLGLDARVGGAWAWGCDSILIQVDAYSEPPRAVRRVADAAQPTHALGAGHVECADTAAIAVSPLNSEKEFGRVVWFRPSGPAVIDSGNVGLSFSLENGRVYGMTGRGSDLLLFFDDAAHRVGARDNVRFGGARFKAAGGRPKDAVFAIEGGGLFRVRER